MLPTNELKWPKSREDHQLATLKAMRPRELCSLARKIDWEEAGPGVIGWISSQRSLDLGTAITLFMRARPGRFNHTPKEDLSEEDRRFTAVLDALCQRINCGYYLPDPSRPMSIAREFAGWMRAQDAEKRASRKGRWVFNPAVVAPMLSDIRAEPRPRRKVAQATGREGGVFRSLLGPLFA